MNPKIDQFINSLVTDKEFINFESKLRTLNINLLERKPVDLNEFVFGKDYLALEKVSPRQAKLLLALDNIDPETNKFLEFVVCVGKGGGKDTISAISLLRFCYRLSVEGPPKDYTGAGLGLPITVLNIATNSQQANAVYFETFKALGKNIFKRLGCNVKSGEVEFPNNITAVSGHSEAEGMEGFNLFACVLDEIAAFKTEGELKGKSIRSKQSAKYLYDMAKSSIRSRFPKTGKLILISFPRFAGDFILQKYEEGKIRNDVYTEFAKTWEFNPYAKEEDFEQEKVRDYREYLSKYCCVPPLARDAYFTDEAKVRAIVDTKIQNPYRDEFDRLDNSWWGKNFRYYIGLDLAFRHDRAALSMVHRDGNKMVGDIFKVWEAPVNGEIDFDNIRKFIFLLKARNFNIGKVLVDTFQCLVGDTSIPMTSGIIKEIKDIVPGEFVYSCDLERQKIAAGKVLRCRKTGNEVPVYRVILDNDKEIICTDTHPFLMRDGEYREAKTLKVNDSLMPLYRKSEGLKKAYSFGTRNHKIKSIEFYGYEDVYDIEIEKYHNFALDAGVFVHNSRDTIQILSKEGIAAENESADRGTKVYDTLKDFINRGSIGVVNCKYTNLLIEELLGLSLLNSSKIDHLAEGSKDLSDSFALAVFAATETFTASAWVRNWSAN